MRRFGLVGFPLGHSFSRRFFSEKFAREGIPDCVYDAFPLSDISELPALLHAHPDLHGLNITIPYKEKVMPYLTGWDEVVSRAGACNCIRITGRQLYGFNTDVTGFRVSLESKLQPWHTQALILGNGGAARAVAYTMENLGIGFSYVARTKRQDLQTLLFSELDKQIILSHQLIVNTTPLGTFPDTETAPPIPYEHISTAHYLFDLVYNPAKTLFLQAGEERGAAIQNGADMLVIQAEESWKIWNQ